MRKRTFIVLSLVVVQLWLAHGIGYLMHEYAHSFFAWFVHDKANPLALDYGHLSLDNVFSSPILIRMSITHPSSQPP
jgi:hypothetical protein